ncbi:MAG TPA: histidinol-phosphate transaminase [Xanthomonadaceae bacterium]|nr:histidinol-phosphate transaminase [Xanthomonadaceae bacterium]
MNTDPLQLARADLFGFTGYSSARSQNVRGEVWLNANESAWANPADRDAVARRYPEPQPRALREALAALYGVAAGQLLIGRGSDEGIDLLVRAFCTPGVDAVLTTPPVFGMYATSARLQGARLVEVPLVDGADDFRADLAQVAARAEGEGAKLVFLCSPGNPAGGTIARESALALARRLEGRALLVVDEAYVEFSDAESLASDVSAHRNLAVLRTLSKAHALAAARIGGVIADAGVIALLQRCQAPYPVPAPCSALALAALQPGSLAQTRARIATTRDERTRLAAALGRLAAVKRVYPSQGNFLLVRFADAEAAFRALLAAGVVVRDQRAAPGLQDALRISIGTPQENDRVIAALASDAREAAA